MRPLDVQYYCVVLNLACGLQRVNMVRDTVATCVATALALCLKKENDRLSIKEWHKRRPHCTHENFMAY